MTLKQARMSTQAKRARRVSSPCGYRRRPGWSNRTDESAKAMFACLAPIKGKFFMRYLCAFEDEIRRDERH